MWNHDLMISSSSTSSRDMWLSLKPNQPAPPSSSPQVSPCLQRATFLSSPTHFSHFLPSRKWVLICDVPCFEAHQPAFPSSSPPVSESSFVTCHVSKLTNPLLPLPPLQLVSPHLWPATFRSSPTRSSLFLPSSWCHDGVESSSALFSYVALNCT